MLRKLRTLFLATAVLCVVVLGALVVAGKLYEDEVKATLVAAINEQLNAPVSVKEMDLTLIARFPKASMRMTDVLAMEVRSDRIPPDTLLHARELFLEFSLWDMFRGNYTVEQVHAANVRLYPGLDANGRETYIIWKTDSTSANSTAIALEKVSFKGLIMRYTDTPHGIVIRSYHEDLLLRGHFAELSNEITLSGDAHLVDWLDEERMVIADRKAQHLRLEMVFNNSDHSFHITKGEVNMGRVPLEIALDLVPAANGGKDLDLRASGLGLPLADVMVLLPEFITSRLANYDMQGEVDLALRYAGPIEKEGPSLSVGANVIKARMKEHRSNTTFTDIFGELALDVEIDEDLIEKGHEPLDRSASGGVHEFINKDGEDHLIVPIGMVGLDDDNNVVKCDQIDRDTFKKAKRHPRGEGMDRQYEVLVLQTYLPDRNGDLKNEDTDTFYGRSEFQPRQ